LLPILGTTIQSITIPTTRRLA